MSDFPLRDAPDEFLHGLRDVRADCCDPAVLNDAMDRCCAEAAAKVQRSGDRDGFVVFDEVDVPTGAEREFEIRVKRRRPRLIAAEQATDLRLLRGEAVGGTTRYIVQTRWRNAQAYCAHLMADDAWAVGEQDDFWAELTVGDRRRRRFCDVI
ncbi:MAG: antibiotic biosynthesis monooxygenase [Pseudomonadota bacterium]